jgi:tetratricopeptide (TPR) repeat protein
VALKTGDMEGSMLIAFSSIPNLFHMGTPLGVLEDELRSIIIVLDSLGQQLGLSVLVPIWHVVCDLQGDEPLPLNLTGEIVDAESAFNSALKENNNVALEHFYAYRAIYYCLLGKHQESLELAKKSLDSGTNVEIWTPFFEGMSRRQEFLGGKGYQPVARPLGE